MAQGRFKYSGPELDSLIQSLFQSHPSFVANPPLPLLPMVLKSQLNLKPESCRLLFALNLARAASLVDRALGDSFSQRGSAEE